MKRTIAILLGLALVSLTYNAFGQIKKPVRQKQDVQQTVSQQNAVSIKPASQKTACWKITGNNGDVEYRWDTESNVVQWIAEMRTQHNEIYEYTASTLNDEGSCDQQNEKLNPKKCWKVTAHQNGQLIEQYLWSTETVARRKVTLLQSNGYQQAKYEETPANDEQSCNGSANVNSNEAACWKITIGSNVTYYWGFESDAQATVNAARNSGQTASYQLSPNKTKDSCQ